MSQAAPPADTTPPASPTLPRCAADIMTREVIHVAPGTTVGAVARLLVAHRISAVPVLDAAGAPLGMVSEGDLLGRAADDRLAGHEWWLALLTEPGAAATSVPATAAARKVEDVMHAPVLTVAADAPLAEVAEMLRAHAIKRLPVMQEGRVVGIVSRADLMCVVAGMRLPVAAPARNQGFAQFVMSMVGDPAHLMPALATTPTLPPTDAPAPVAATNFRSLVDAFQHERADAVEHARWAVELDRQRQVTTLLRAHLDAELWQALLDHARTAAEHGAKEFLLLRFPSGLCSDGGRKIGVAEAGWETTLRGEAAELYDRWERTLKPGGFGLEARILDYPGGKPGDVGLVLLWGD